MIEINKKYRNRVGETVRIICVDRDDPEHPVIGLMRLSKDNDEVISTYTKDGFYFSANDPCEYDLVEVSSPWTEFVVDEPVLVRNEEREEWVRRHFAGVENGLPCCWDNGLTSWTSKHQEKFSWDYCIRPE